MMGPQPQASGAFPGPMEHCWREVGVDGDRTCPELATFVHCRNCPVLAAAARQFFDRPPPAGYLDSWREILERGTAPADGDAVSVLVFRLGREWLGVPPSAVTEVGPPRRVHRIPHRSTAVLAGIVNIQGRLLPCLRLERFLRLDATDDGVSVLSGSAAKMIVVAPDGKRRDECWAIGVNEIVGIARIAPSAFRQVPSTVGIARERVTAAMFTWRNQHVGLIDEKRLLDWFREVVAG